MITINASLSRKVPGSESYSSNQACASITLEASPFENNEELLKRFQNAYELLDQAITDKLSQMSSCHSFPEAPTSSSSAGTPISHSEELTSTTTTETEKIAKPHTLITENSTPEDGITTRPAQTATAPTTHNNSKTWKSTPATIAQHRAIKAIARSRQVPASLIDTILTESYGVDSIEALNKSDASNLIKTLQTFTTEAAA